MKLQEATHSYAKFAYGHLVFPTRKIAVANRS
jgi:hypothetical protein